MPIENWGISGFCSWYLVYLCITFLLAQSDAFTGSSSLTSSIHTENHRWSCGPLKYSNINKNTHAFHLQTQQKTQQKTYSFKYRNLLLSKRNRSLTLMAVEEETDSVMTNTNTIDNVLGEIDEKRPTKKIKRKRKQAVFIDENNERALDTMQKLNKDNKKDINLENVDEYGNTGMLRSENDLNKRILEDITRMREAEKKKREEAILNGDSKALQDKENREENPFFESLSNNVSTFLFYDFVVVLMFLGLFLTGLAQKSLTNDSQILDFFNVIWNPVIQPALGLLMAGTLAGGAISYFQGEDENQTYKR